MASGGLSGTPTAAGTFNFSVKASDNSSGIGAPFATIGSYTMAVAAPTITLAPTTLPALAVGTAFSHTLVASGGQPAYSYAIAAGALPAGMVLNTATGVLSGTPTHAGSYSFILTATDSGGFIGSQSYSGTVAGGVVVLPAESLGTASAGTAYSHGFSASGGTPGYTYSLQAGSLPTGLTLSSAGLLSGTPTQAGSFSFSVRATDSSTGTGAPFTGSQNYTLTVTAPAISLSPSTLPAASGGVSYLQSVSASGGIGSYTFSLSVGTLPPGIGLSSAGVLSGTPTATGSYAFTLTATDSLGFTGSQAYTVIVNAPTIAITPATLPAAAGALPTTRH